MPCASSAAGPRPRSVAIACTICSGARGTNNYSNQTDGIIHMQSAMLCAAKASARSSAPQLKSMHLQRFQVACQQREERRPGVVPGVRRRLCCSRGLHLCRTHQQRCQQLREPQALPLPCLCIWCRCGPLHVRSQSTAKTHPQYSKGASAQRCNAVRISASPAARRPDLAGRGGVGSLG
jgi:hypothetical protein